MDQRGATGYTGIALLVVLMCTMVAVSSWGVSYYLGSQNADSDIYSDHQYSIYGTHSVDGTVHPVGGKGTSHYVNESSKERIIYFDLSPVSDAGSEKVSVSLIIDDPSGSPVPSLYAYSGTENVGGTDYSQWVLKDDSNGRFVFLTDERCVVYHIHVTIGDLDFTAVME